MSTTDGHVNGTPRADRLARLAERAAKGEPLFENGESMPTVPPRRADAAPAALGPCRQAILHVLNGAKAPVPVKSLARRTGYGYNSYFRGAMADLVRQGLVTRLPEGYQLADTPTPH